MTRSLWYSDMGFCFLLRRGEVYDEVALALGHG